MLALRHAELGMILATQNRYRLAVAEYRSSLGFIQLLQSEGTHEQQRLIRQTSLASPPPGQLDIDLGRLEAEVRVALVESLAAVGSTAEAHDALQRARPLTRGLFRRRLRRRLDRVAAVLAASPGAPTGVDTLRRALSTTNEPAQERALRLRLANLYLDSSEFAAAAREALLLVKSADGVGDRVVRAGARQVLGLALEGLGRTDEALPILGDAFSDLRDHGDTAGMVGMAEALAQRLLHSGDAGAAATVLRTTQRAAAESGDHDAELSVTTMLGVVLDESGDHSAAVDTLTGAADRAVEYGKPLARADALHSTAVALGQSTSANDLVEALALLEEAKRIYAELDLPDRVAGCDHEAAATLGRHGSYDAASARYLAALTAYRRLPEPLRDTGAWPDEVADCEQNIAWLADTAGPPGTGLFQSGGHAMTHVRA